MFQRHLRKVLSGNSFCSWHGRYEAKSVNSMERDSPPQFTNRELSQLADFWHRLTPPIFLSWWIKTKLQALRRMNPWPDVSPLDGQPSHVWSLDGGGRHLVIDLIRECQPRVFLEVGVFVGGSALQWLRNSADEMTTQRRNERTMFSHMRLFQSRFCAATIGSGGTPKAGLPCSLSYTSWLRHVIATLSPSGQLGF